MFANKMQLKHPGISLCGIKPPDNFKPECLLGDGETNFKISNQYVHQMLCRWGPTAEVLTTIRSLQDSQTQRSPLVSYFSWH